MIRLMHERDGSLCAGQPDQAISCNQERDGANDFRHHDALRQLFAEECQPDADWRKHVNGEASCEHIRAENRLDQRQNNAHDAPLQFYPGGLSVETQCGEHKADCGRAMARKGTSRLRLRVPSYSAHPTSHHSPTIRAAIASPAPVRINRPYSGASSDIFIFHRASPTVNCPGPYVAETHRAGAPLSAHRGNSAASSVVCVGGVSCRGPLPLRLGRATRTLPILVGASKRLRPASGNWPILAPAASPSRRRSGARPTFQGCRIGEPSTSGIARPGGSRVSSKRQSPQRLPRNIGSTLSGNSSNCTLAWRGLKRRLQESILTFTARRLSGFAGLQNGRGA